MGKTFLKEEFNLGWVWNRHAPTFFLSHEQCTRPIEKITDMCLHFFYGSCALFMEPTNMNFSKFFFKIGSYGTIYIFKNYFITIFSIFNKINCIQMDPKSECTFFTVLCLYFVQRFYNDNVLIFSCIYLYMMLICRRGFCHLTKAQG